MGLRLLIAASAVLGGASLLALAAFLYHGSFQVIDLGLGRTSALLWDAGLSLTFFVQHSGMIRRSFRRRLETLLPRAAFGAVFSIVSGAVLLLLLVLWQRVPPELASLQGPWRWGSRAVYFLAVAGFAWGVRSLGSFDALGVRGVLGHLRGDAEKALPLAVRGPYRWVRHPLYTFTLAMIWSCPDLTADRLLLNVLWSAWIAAAARLEERDLVFLFGDAYRTYQRDVPMLIPIRWRPVPERRVE